MANGVGNGAEAKGYATFGNSDEEDENIPLNSMRDGRTRDLEQGAG